MAGGHPAWLFLGPEIGQKRAAVDELYQRFAAGGPVDRAVHYAFEAKIDALIADIAAPDLFGNRRFVELRAVDRLTRKPDIERIGSWIKTGSPDALLVMTSDETRVDARLQNLLPASHRTVFWELFDSEKRRWLATRMRAAGLRGGEDAISYVLDTVENNTEALGQAVERLRALPGDQPLTPAAVAAVLDESREETTFRLWDAIVDAQLSRAMRILGRLRDAGDGDAGRILTGLLWQVRRLRSIHQAMSSGNVSVQQAAQAAGVRSKLAIRGLERQLKLLGAEDLRWMLVALADTEVDTRSAPASAGPLLLDRLVYRLIRRRGRPLPAPYPPLPHAASAG